MTRVSGILLLLTISLLAALRAQSGAVQRFVTTSESKLWIDGSSTINTFTCTTFRVNGEASIATENGPETQSRRGPEVKVSIRVRTLDCGNRMMNGDMYDAMKEKENPEILYELVRAQEVPESETESGWISVKTEGALTIAGTTRQVEIPLKIRRLSDGRIRVVGRQSLLMSDFGITPPTAFFGLIRAHEELVVNFDLVAKIESDCGEVLARDGNEK